MKYLYKNENGFGAYPPFAGFFFLGNPNNTREQCNGILSQKPRNLPSIGTIYRANKIGLFCDEFKFV